MATTSPRLRPDGRVRRSDRARRGDAPRARAKATAAWTRTRRSRSRSCTRRSASPSHAAAADRADRRPRRRPRRLRAAVLGVGDRLSAEHRRQAAAQLAGVHPGHLRVHDPRRGAVGGARHAGAERPADAVSPGVQRAALRAGEPQPVLPVHRGAATRSSTSKATREFLETLESAGGDRPLRTKNQDTEVDTGTAKARQSRGTLLFLCVLCVLCVLVCRQLWRCRLPAGHARSAEVHPAARVDVLRRRALGAAARRRAPSRAASCATTRCSTPAR